MNQTLTSEEQITIPVSGMTCAGCQASVQQALEHQAGVRSANVNLLTNQATVVYDPSVANPDKLVQAIRSTGYEASIDAPGRAAFEEQEAQDREREEEARDTKRKALFSLIAGAAAMLFSMPLMSGHATDPLLRLVMKATPLLEHAAPWLYAIEPGILKFILLGLTSLVCAWAGRDFYVRAWVSFRHHAADMNTLIGVGTGAAFLYSVVATFFPSFFLSRGISADVYYEAVVLIIALVLVGNWLENRAKVRTSAALRKLANLQPKTARVIRNLIEQDIPVGKVRHGDIVVVRPGEQIPVDGEVIAGTSSVNEALLTGESMPVPKEPGAKVIGGTSS
jgi:P-type Cu+ transporter